MNSCNWPLGFLILMNVIVIVVIVYSDAFGSFDNGHCLSLCIVMHVCINRLHVRAFLIFVFAIIIIIINLEFVSLIMHVWVYEI